MNPFSDDAAAPAEEGGEEKMKQDEEGEGEGNEGEKRQVEQKEEEKEKRQKEQKERKEQAMEPTGIENRYQRLKGSKGRQHSPATAGENVQGCNKKEEKKEKGGGKNKKVLALKSTNQRLRQPTPPKQPPPEFEVVIPAERPSPVLIAKRTRPAGKPEAVGPQKPNNRNKFRRVSPSSVPLRRLSAGIGMGMSMLSSPFGSPAAAAAPAAVPTQSKARKKGARRPTAAAAASAGGVGGPAPAVQVIPIGDVDQVINPHNAPVEAALLGSSPPAMAWLRVKASGVVSGARRAADRLLKTRVGGSSRAKGYALLDEEPPTLSKENMKVQQANLKIRSNNGSSNCKKQLDTRIALPTIEENSFGELIDNDISFNSFLLRDDEDELSLPNGSYVVNYDNGDTVITAAVTQLEDGGKDTEPLSESPLAQFTPGVGWDLKRKKGVEFLKGRPSGVIDGGQVDSPSGRPSLSVVTEVDDELFSGHYNHISGEHGLQPHPRNTQGGKKVVKKMAMENLRNPASPAARTGAGAIKVYGRKKTSRIHSRSLDGFGVGRKELHG